MRRGARACPGPYHTVQGPGPATPARLAGEAALHSNWDTTLKAAGLRKGMGSTYTELNQGNNMETSAQWGGIWVLPFNLRLRPSGSGS